MRVAMEQADVDLVRGWIPTAEAQALFDGLTREAGWKQDYIRIQGQTIALPRLTAWHGTRGYRYSGIENLPQPWTPLLDGLRVRLAQELKTNFNSVLCNQYRDGRDSVSWHADDERELGPTPVIASISLGASRKFSFKRRDGTRIDLMLENGDLLVMRGITQQHWLHQVPKSARVDGPRINLTFRTVL